MLPQILAAFGLQHAQVQPFGSGLINHTWLVRAGQDRFILQRINTHVFKNPEAIASNIECIGSYLKQTQPDYYFVDPVRAQNGATCLQLPDGWFRLFPFVPHSHTIDVVTTTEEAFEAAAQFGRFTSVLRNFNVDELQTAVPQFHNLDLRYQQFLQALQQPPSQRHEAAADVIDYLQQQQPIVETFRALQMRPDFRQRVTHHDTKISNVLFNEENKGICVIDLDTVMPGYFISDIGDMMRTYLSPVSEEEQDFSKIEIRDAFFYAIAKGYLQQMQHELSAAELEHFVYAGKFIIYMQALRFVTDYLNNDSYYGQKYEGHNLVRAGNQVALLKKLIEKEARFQQYIRQEWPATQSPVV